RPVQQRVPVRLAGGLAPHRHRDRLSPVRAAPRRRGALRELGVSLAVPVTRVAGLALVPDGRRPGHMHEGVPPGGPLVPELHAAANVAVGNAPGAPAIELVGSIELAVERDVAIATEDGVVRRVSPGEAVRIDGRADRRVRYVAI